MNSQNGEKGHWFNVIIFFLFLLAALGACAQYNSYIKAVAFFQADHQLPLSHAFWDIYPHIMLIPGLWIFVISPILLAHFLRKRRRYKFCIALSICIMIAFPWGTILGIFTIVLLRRGSIKTEFLVNHQDTLTAPANKSLENDA